MLSSLRQNLPGVLATKPNSETHVCIDYRALNSITQKDLQKKVQRSNGQNEKSTHLMN